MHATVRRYEGVDASRTVELTKKVNETLIPKLSKLPGFDGYFLMEAPDDSTAAALALTIAAGGALSKVETIPLMSVEEGVEAMRKAAGASYSPPGS